MENTLITNIFFRSSGAKKCFAAAFWKGQDLFVESMPKMCMCARARACVRACVCVHTQSQLSAFVCAERHPIEYATDGTNRWWQSPSIKNGMEYHYVTITLDLKQVRPHKHSIFMKTYIDAH